MAVLLAEAAPFVHGDPRDGHGLLFARQGEPKLSTRWQGIALIIHNAALSQLAPSTLEVSLLLTHVTPFLCSTEFQSFILFWLLI